MTVNAKRAKWEAKQAEKRTELGILFNDRRAAYAAARKALRAAEGAMHTAENAVLDTGRKLAKILDGQCYFLDGEPRIGRKVEREGENTWMELVL